MPNRVRFLVQVAVLVALAIVLRRFIPPVPSLNLGGFPLIMAGFILGGPGGAMVGAISDLIGCWFSGHVPTPLLTVTAALTGCLPVMLLNLFGRTKHVRVWELGVAIGFGQMVTKAWLVPWIMSATFGHPWQVLVVKNVVVQAFHIPLYAILAWPLLKAFGHFGQPAIGVEPEVQPSNVVPLVPKATTTQERIAA